MFFRSFLAPALFAVATLLSMFAAEAKSAPELVFRFDFTSESPTPEKNPRDWEWEYCTSEEGMEEKPAVRDGIAEFSIGGVYSKEIEFDCNAFVCEFEIAEMSNSEPAVVLSLGTAENGRIIKDYGFFVRVIRNGVSLEDRMTRRIVVHAENLDLAGRNFKKIRVENFPGGSRILVGGKVVAESEASVSGTARSCFGIGDGRGLGGQRYYGKLDAKLKSLSLYQGVPAGTKVKRAKRMRVSPTDSPGNSAEAGNAGAEGRIIRGKYKRMGVPTEMNRFTKQNARLIRNAFRASDKSSRKELPGVNYNALWPVVTLIPYTVVARVVKDGPGEWIYETQHFQFISNARIALSSIEDIALIFEGAYQANLALPISSPCNFWDVSKRGRFKGKFYEYYDQYAKAAGTKSSTGKCIYKVRPGIGNNKLLGGCVHVPFSSLNLARQGDCYVRTKERVRGKTLVHEITHLMANPGAHNTKWMSEGLADYVGYSYDEDGRTDFAGNKDRIANGRVRPGRSKRFDGSFRDFVCSRWNSYDLAYLLVYYLLHIEGKGDAALMRAYAFMLKSGASYEDAAEVLLNGRSWAEFEENFCSAIKSELNIGLEFEK